MCLGSSECIAIWYSQAGNSRRMPYNLVSGQGISAVMTCCDAEIHSSASAQACTDSTESATWCSLQCAMRT